MWLPRTQASATAWKANRPAATSTKDAPEAWGPGLTNVSVSLRASQRALGAYMWASELSLWSSSLSLPVHVRSSDGKMQDVCGSICVFADCDHDID